MRLRVLEKYEINGNVSGFVNDWANLDQMFIFKNMN